MTNFNILRNITKTMCTETDVVTVVQWFAVLPHGEDILDLTLGVLLLSNMGFYRYSDFLLQSKIVLGDRE